MIEGTRDKPELAVTVDSFSRINEGQIPRRSRKAIGGHMKYPRAVTRTIDRKKAKPARGWAERVFMKGAAR